MNSSIVSPLDRVLALEVRLSKFGFVVIEQPRRLLDWGVRSFGERGASSVSTFSDRVRTLVQFNQPSFVVVRAREYRSKPRKAAFINMLGTIRKETKRHSVKFGLLTSNYVRGFFSTHRNKHDVAASLAEQFEELSWKLPHRRKPYESEARTMLVFDALASATAFLGASDRGETGF